MNVIDYRNDFLESIKVESVSTGEGSSSCFAQAMANQLIEQEIILDYIPCYYEGEGARKKKYRVDGYSFDDFDETMNLFIVDYDGIENKAITKSKIIPFIEKISYFVDQSQNSNLNEMIEVSTPCADLVDLLRIKRKEINRYKVFYFTDGTISDSVKIIDEYAIDNVYTEVHTWDIDRLYNVYSLGNDEGTISVDFSDYLEYGIPCLEASQAGTEEYKGYLCVVPGEVIADIYDKYGSKLLEGNVRSFLSSKVAVNKKIRETIKNKPDMFFAYNNGISATALGLEFVTHGSSKYIKIAKNFQIINGGQTTASLSNTRHKDGADLSGIFVQMKLTEIGDMEEDLAAELVQNISRSSNSQNKVSEADFFATHPFHIRMEQISRRLLAPAYGGIQYNTKWFYERARGQYTQASMRMTKSEKKKFEMINPPYQKITKTDLSKFRNSWNELPYYVSKGAQTNFMKYAELINDSWEKDDSNFNERYYQESVAIAIIFKLLEKKVTKEYWYEGGYRANIVTYTIALFHKLIRDKYKKKDFDLSLIWNAQYVPDDIEKLLLLIAEDVYYCIVSDDRPVQNVTQWCKQQACWERVSHIKREIPDYIEKYLITAEEEKKAKKDAKKDQKLSSEIDNMKEVIEIGAKVWDTILEYVVNSNIATSDEISALRAAAKIPAKLPNGIQCQKILDLKIRLENEGIKW